MDTFETLFELMTSEALQGALDVSASNLSPVALLDAAGRTADDARTTYLANGCTGAKPVRSPESLRLVVDLLGHCERKPDLQARVMEALVDALDGSLAGIQVCVAPTSRAPFCVPFTVVSWRTFYGGFAHYDRFIAARVSAVHCRCVNGGWGLGDW